MYFKAGPGSYISPPFFSNLAYVISIATPLFEIWIELIVFVFFADSDSSPKTHISLG